MKLQITPKSKVNFPIDNENNIYSYEGDFNLEMFDDGSPQYEYLKFQKGNFENILEIFNEMNLYFEKSWIAVFNNDNNNKAVNFMMKSNTNEEGVQIFWHKYATSNPGSGQNWIYTVKNNTYVKVQLSRWIAGVGRVI